jgi:predicted nucleotidyltransferase component of viral defense system
MAINNQIDLMLWVMREFSTHFAARAVLHGGMALSLLSSARNTNDLDYLLLEYKSKKDPVKSVSELLKKLAGLKFEYRLSSKNLAYFLNYNGIKIQIEIKVEESCDFHPVSTGNLTLKSGQPSFIVNIVSLEWALANKLAAWNERRLMRDLYDVYFMHVLLNATPDIKLLKKRLKNIVPLEKFKENPRSVTLAEFSTELKSMANRLRQADIEDELKDYLENRELAGLDLKIKLALNKLAGIIENL